MTNREVVTAFFTGYQRHQADSMIACLHPEVEFSDLAFQRITGAQVQAMWRWFCEKPVEVPSFELTKDEGDRVQARYRVKYSLEGGRVVDYVIVADFTLQSSKIVRQVDTPTISNFAFARMALGFPACLLALTPLFKTVIRSGMRKKLTRFQTESSKRKQAAAGA
jgi:hypothetical protein